MGIFKKLFGKNNSNPEENQNSSLNTQDESNEQEVEQQSQEQELEQEQEKVSENIQQFTTDEVDEAEQEQTEEEQVENGSIETLEAEKKQGFFTKLKEGLNKTRKSILNSVDNVLSSFTKIDEDLFEELEETLIMSDIGVETTTKIIEGLRERVKKQRVTEASEVKQLLIDEITQLLEEDEEEFELKKPSIILVIGVNGVGKTTTIGKLANQYKSEGNKVLLAAADTFRAAAIDQLEIWGQRAGIDVIKHQENSDPAAVVFDAVQAAKSRKTDILICDTAGRLHNKKNLMEELRKIFKVINREYPDAYKEVLLVLDGTTGQNALQQAKVFKEVADITGIILTKLDGTAKGGIVIAIKSELKIPVRYIGIGEGINDLQQFNASDFAKALFNE